MFSEDVPPVVPVDFEGRIVVFGTDYSRGAGMTRILKKSKPLVIRDHHRDIAACLMQHPGVKMSNYTLCQEVYGHNFGWEIDMVKIMSGTHSLLKHGYIGGSYDAYTINERTWELFDKPGPVV